MPHEYVNSPYRCVRCGKRLIAEYGQHEDDGDLVESHSCWNCDITYNIRAHRPERSHA
jgi:DNA-directed RNA polymerase subunit RPC12/RpoP